MLFSNKDLRKLLIPLLLEQVLIVLVGMVDTMMVSGVGEAAVSGVSLVDSLNLLLSCLFAALATGGAVICSQFIGKKDMDKAALSAKMLFYVVLLVSGGMMLLCVALRNPLLRLVYGHIDADVMGYAQTYFLMTALSYPFLAVDSASCAVLRAQGNSRMTLVSAVMVNLINVCGNWVTINVFGWGVFGAGLSTLIARICGSVFSQMALGEHHCRFPRPKLLQLQWNRDIVGKIMTVGLPNGFENSIFQLGKLLLLRLVSTFGTVSIAANAVGNSLSAFQVLPGSAMGLAMITVVGQCVGARQFDQVRYYVKKLMIMLYACMGTLNILMLLCQDFLVSLYNLSPETAQLAWTVTAIHGVGSIFLWPMAFTFPNALRAAGDTRYTMTISIFSMMAFRVVFGYILAAGLGMGVTGVWIAMQIDWVFRIIMFVRRYLSRKWESKVLV